MFVLPRVTPIHISNLRNLQSKAKASLYFPALLQQIALLLTHQRLISLGSNSFESIEGFYSALAAAGRV